MSKPNAFARSALMAAAGAVAFSAMASAPIAAQAQPYGAASASQSYEACRRAATNRTIMGGLLGAAAGAALGFNVGARGHRNDGAWTGAAVGGLGGGLVGNRTAQQCDTGAPYPRAAAASDYGRSYDADRAYRYGSRYEDRRYDDEDRYVSVDRAPVAVVEDRAPAADGCTLAESPIYLPDGRTQKRFVRVCQDSSGRYQVVD